MQLSGLLLFSVIEKLYCRKEEVCRPGGAFDRAWATDLGRDRSQEIVANAGRVIVTGLIGQWFGVKYAQGVFHSFSGWIIFLVAFAGLFGVHTLLQKWAQSKIGTE